MREACTKNSRKKEIRLDPPSKTDRSHTTPTERLTFEPFRTSSLDVHSGGLCATYLTPTHRGGATGTGFGGDRGKAKGREWETFRRSKGGGEGCVLLGRPLGKCTGIPYAACMTMIHCALEIERARESERERERVTESQN